VFVRQLSSAPQKGNRALRVKDIPQLLPALLQPRKKASGICCLRARATTPGNTQMLQVRLARYDATLITFLKDRKVPFALEGSLQILHPDVEASDLDDIELPKGNPVVNGSLTLVTSALRYKGADFVAEMMKASNWDKGNAEDWSDMDNLLYEILTTWTKKNTKTIHNILKTSPIKVLTKQVKESDLVQTDAGAVEWFLITFEPSITMTRDLYVEDKYLQSYTLVLLYLAANPRKVSGEFLTQTSETYRRALSLAYANNIDDGHQIQDFLLTMETFPEPGVEFRTCWKHIAPKLSDEYIIRHRAKLLRFQLEDFSSGTFGRLDIHDNYATLGALLCQELNKLKNPSLLHGYFVTLVRKTPEHGRSSFTLELYREAIPKSQSSDDVATLFDLLRKYKTLSESALLTWVVQALPVNPSEDLQNEIIAFIDAIMSTSWEENRKFPSDVGYKMITKNAQPLFIKWLSAYDTSHAQKVLAQQGAIYSHLSEKTVPKELQTAYDAAKSIIGAFLLEQHSKITMPWWTNKK
jgi:hypothetical protein